MDKLPPPPGLQLTGNVSDNWAIGEEASELYNTFTWDIKDDQDHVTVNQSMILKHVLNKFEDFCTPKKNLTFERHNFFYLSPKTRGDN